MTIIGNGSLMPVGYATSLTHAKCWRTALPGGQLQIDVEYVPSCIEVTVTKERSALLGSAPGAATETIWPFRVLIVPD